MAPSDEVGAIHRYICHEALDLFLLLSSLQKEKYCWKCVSNVWKNDVGSQIVEGGKKNDDGAFKGNVKESPKGG